MQIYYLHFHCEIIKLLLVLTINTYLLTIHFYKIADLQITQSNTLYISTLVEMNTILLYVKPNLI